jgi:solute carrier family 26 (sodium-independent sulfate anion transporter), member 11
MAGRILAKSVGINSDYRDEPPRELIGGSQANGSGYVEAEPTFADYIRSITPNGPAVKEYFISLFPFLTWIFHYNLIWLTGDLIAGITVGIVVIPQGMAYALLAQLPPEYGLYTSFMGFLLYWAFATSKDITIGVSLPRA